MQHHLIMSWSPPKARRVISRISNFQRLGTLSLSAELRRELNQIIDRIVIDYPIKHRIFVALGRSPRVLTHLLQRRGAKISELAIHGLGQNALLTLPSAHSLASAPLVSELKSQVQIFCSNIPDDIKQIVLLDYCISGRTICLVHKAIRQRLMINRLKLSVRSISLLAHRSWSPYLAYLSTRGHIYCLNDFPTLSETFYCESFDSIKDFDQMFC